MKTSAIVALFLLAATAPSSSSERQPDPDAASGCIAYGDNYAFMLAPLKGWVLSCNVGEHSGVPVALWPTGESWDKSSAVMYVNPSTKPVTAQSLKDFASWSASEFRKDKPGVKLAAGESLQTGDHSRVLVQHFTGDPWGNYEAVAYIESKTIFAIITLSARTQAKFKEYYPAFVEVVSSYRFIARADVK